MEKKRNDVWMNEGQMDGGVEIDEGLRSVDV